jgi:hypothetical protein
MITPVGELSIGEAVPGAASAAIAGQAGINLALPDLQGRLEALLAFAPAEVNFAAQLTLALQTVAAVQAAIAGGISPPSISAQLAIVAGLIADIQDAMLSIDAQLSIILDFQALLVGAGVHVYAYNGEVQDFGAELDAEIGTGLPGGLGPAEDVDALVLVTNIPATWAAMSQVFQVSP